MFTNGARLYVDHAHPEYSSPECRTPREATLYDVAGEEIMRRALEIANKTLDPSQAITLYKNNSDGKGNSYGTHENYLVQRDLEFAHLIRAMVPHFVSRQVIIGAGKVGAETESALEHNPTFQLSQRAEFFEEIVGLETTLKRPIINTRDEPHSDAERFRRLHVIIGDANMSQVATFVKLGSTALLLAALEEFGPDDSRRCRVRRFKPYARTRSTSRSKNRSPVMTISRGLPGTTKTSCGPWRRVTSNGPEARPSPRQTKCASFCPSGANCSTGFATTSTPWPIAWTGSLSGES